MSKRYTFFVAVCAIAASIAILVGGIEISYKVRAFVTDKASIPADTASADGPCAFDSSGTHTDSRTKHMNGYNACISNDYFAKVVAAEPFPSGQISDSLDRKMHIEQLLRFQDPNKIGYMYILGQNGNLITWYTINGKPSSTQSSLTPNKQASTVDHGEVIDSPADDGSFGPNEGGDQGVLFFTASGCMIEHAPTWIYSDCPLNIAASPVTIATLDANAKPSSAIDKEFGGTGDKSNGQ